MAINWKKTVFVVCDIVIAAYLLLAITAFNKPGGTPIHCTEVKIDIEQNGAISGFMNANEIKRILHPRAVLPVKVNDNTISYSYQGSLLAFFTAYTLLCLITYFCMILTGVDSTNSITIALSCISNVGPSLDTGVGPNITWASLPTAVKWLCSAMMLMGRLEIFSVLIIFTRAFWKEN